ncbi:MAG TPA: hypothetical protein VEQ10_03860, partial [Vicinamibacteria bacterium]|nr:hypothetical protein [Vicinamibacteria bacterium]
AIYGVGSLLLCGLLAWKRRWLELEMIAFTLPLAATAFLVYSGGGVTNYNVYHLFALAIALDWAFVLRVRPR